MKRRNFWTLGHLDVRVRNVSAKSRLMFLYLSRFLFPNHDGGAFQKSGRFKHFAPTSLRGNDMCMATEMTVPCRCDTTHRHRAGKQLSQAIRSLQQGVGCRICVTVWLPVRQCGETMYWQANANTPFPLPPHFKPAQQ